MIVLLITIVFGLAFAVFANFNTGTVDINFIKYVLRGVPLYLVILAPLLIGVFISYIVYLIRALSSDLTVSEYKDEVKKLKAELTEVTKEAHQLELENTKLKAKEGEFDEDSM
jgi:uncharacterized integral membrane protein